MTYEEFKQEITDYLVQQPELSLTPDMVKLYEDGYTSDDPLELQLIRDTNIRYHRLESDTLIGDIICIVGTGNIAQMCRQEVKYLFKEWQANGWPAVIHIFKENLAMAAKARQTGLIDSLTNYESIKEHLIIRPLNFTDRRYELKDTIYKRVGDIALVLYLLAFDETNGQKHDVGSIAPIRILRNVKSVNQAFPKDEILSRKVYLYEREKKELRMLEL